METAAGETASSPAPESKKPANTAGFFFCRPTGLRITAATPVIVLACGLLVTPDRMAQIHTAGIRECATSSADRAADQRAGPGISREGADGTADAGAQEAAR